jgi:hypothetical protein
MARNYRLWENAQTISLLKPAADAAGRTSTYVSLKNAHKAFAVFYITQGNAATILLSVLQAQDAIGTNSKAVTAMPIAVNLDTDTVPADLMTIVAAAASYTTDAGVKTKIVMFEIDPIESMDLNSNTLNAAGVPQPFNHIAVSTGASNAANITAALLILAPLRFAQQNPPTANV